MRDELTACLILVVPTGMSEGDRREWLAVAWNTLKHIPPDILKIGARKARETCDHPAKIIPAIIRETAEPMRWRREAREEAREAKALPAPEPDYVTADEAAEILKRFGLKRSPDNGDDSN